MIDLSNLLPGDPVLALTGRSSMNATNTVSDPPPFTAPGSVSESSAGAASGQPGPHGTEYGGRHLVRGDQ